LKRRVSFFWLVAPITLFNTGKDTFEKTPAVSYPGLFLNYAKITPPHSSSFSTAAMGSL
jgi:hypothetical protein